MLNFGSRTYFFQIAGQDFFNVFDVEADLPVTVGMSSRFAQPREISAAMRNRQKSPSTPRSRPQSRTKEVASNKKESQKVQGKYHQHKHDRKKKAEDMHHSDSEDAKNDADDSDPEEKLCSHLQTCMAECSRQRLRALQMSLRHYGNVDNRENQIKLSHRAIQMMTDLYQDSQGIDYNRLHSCMDRAHLKTGRDSVKARNKRNDLETKQAMSVDQIDKDFLKRLEELLVREHKYFDIDMLRTEFSKWDHHRLGKIDKEGAVLICNDKTPLYGALLKNLLNRCDEDKDLKVSWPLLLNFMEKAQASAWKNHPELSELPEKEKENKSNRIVTPEPLDELSSSTRSKVMSKLLKRAPSRRSPIQPQSSEEQQDKKSTNSEPNKKDETGGTKTDLAPTKENILEKDLPLGKNQPGHEGAQPKGESQETQPSNKVGDKVREIEASPKGIKAAIFPQGFHPQQSTSDPPKERLQLDWIYGYRGHGQAHGSHPHLLASGEIAYFIACTVVLYNQLDHSQRHYREHTESVRCMSVHSAGVIVASGQDAGKTRQENQAHVRIWRCDTLATLHVIGQGLFEKTVVAVTFMAGQNILATCDNSRDKKLTIWNTKDGVLIADTFIFTEVVMQMSFNPKWPEILVTCGKEHLAWWKVYVEAETIQPTAKPNYEGFLKARFINCLRHNQKGDLITGDSNGTVYVWGDGGNKITNFVKHGHEVFNVRTKKKRKKEMEGDDG
ncbi:echinoderm microtubule-associated protein-like 1 [Plakobranchus ocellatus]|uniref:Echinoderm microtubule-associated protein-like 1 n=1 Tax=Plakobranchus ocellatus TaxID=259542 RepID=A0AAV4B331_9GAST|nr:echinoderm microtubule-associated protein-like 1 [Plakobranchus ocellatus]